MEILKQLNKSDTLDGIFASVGGGGLVAGICEYVKRIGGPNTQVVGVETVDGDAMDRSLKNGERATLKDVGPFSDGTAVKIVGQEPFRICKELLDGVVKTDNDEICAAIKDIFEGPLWLLLIHSTLLILSRDTICHRACWRAGISWTQAVHSRQQSRRREQALRRGS